LAIRPEIQEAISWYSKNRLIYKALSKRVANIVHEVLEAKKVNYHSVAHRAKSLKSYKEKASKEFYKNPIFEIKDLAGIRIITYTSNDAQKVFDIIRKTFEIHPEDIVDKSQELGTDKVGYRSIHCIGNLGKDRGKLPENIVFKNMCFEIQIRTILQHAWAEFEHDRNYKFGGVLPKEIKRRLSVLAGTLELLDKEFDDLSREIDNYALEVKEKTETGDLDIPIDSTSLKAYMYKKFGPLVRLGVKPYFDQFDKQLLNELSIMKIRSIKDLDDIVPKDYIEKKSKLLPDEQYKGSFFGILIDIMIIHGMDTYFNKVLEDTALGLDERYIEFYKGYGLNIDKYSNRILLFPPKSKAKGS